MDKGRIIQTLLDMKAVTFSVEPPYTFSSGMKSPIYCDNRVLISNVDSRKMVVDAFCELVPNSTKQIAGVATAGIPWAAWVAQEMDLPMIYIRSKAKAHGQTNQIEGKLITDETVLIEDLISTAGSSLKALDCLRDEDVFVTKICAIFTYNFDTTKQTLKEFEVKAQTVIQFEDMLAYAKEHAYLNDQELSEVLDWQKDPNNWK